MKQNKYIEIEELLERFFEGETTNAEEQELYEFFKRPDLPEHLKPYKSAFDYFDTGIIREVNEKEGLKVPTRKVPFKRYFIAGLAIAASLLLLLVLTNQGDVKPEDFNPYAGSYIIHNGVRTEIPEDIARELYKAVVESEIKKSKPTQTAYNSDRYFKEITEKQLQKEEEIRNRKWHIKQLEEQFLNR